MAKSILQTEKECWVTRSTDGLHKHHIFYGKNRQASEKWGCWVWLRNDWHNMASYGVHFNKELDDTLKQACQEEFERRYSHELFMQIFGRNYIKGGE